MLVKSLSKAEKRSIRIVLPPDSRSTHLFNRLLEMRKFDKNELKKHCLVPKSQLGEAMNYLFHQILESISVQKNRINLEDSIRLKIQKGRILIERGIRQAGQKQLKKALAKATELEFFELEMEALQQLKQLSIRHLEPKKMDSHVAHFQQLEKIVFDKWEERKKLEWVSLEAFAVYYRLAQPNTPEEKQVYKSLLTKPELAANRTLSSFRSKIIYLNTLGMIYEVLSRWDDMIQCRKGMVESYEQKTSNWASDQRSQLAAINNWQLGLLRTGKTQQSLKALALLKSFPEKQNLAIGEALYIDWFRMYYSNQAEWLIRKGAFNQASKMLEEVLPKAEKMLPAVYCFAIRYSLAYCQFGSNNPTEALTTLNHLTYQDDTQFKQEYFRYALILQLIIHADLGNTELLEALLRSATRYLKKLGGVSKSEKALFRYLKKIQTPAELEALIDFEKAIQQIPNNYHQRIIWHHLHLPAWHLSKKEKTSFAEAYLKLSQPLE